jgi:fructan beta-fructosidase
MPTRSLMRVAVLAVLASLMVAHSAWGVINTDYRSRDNPEGVLNGLQLVEFAGTHPEQPELYREKYRPQFHFTSATNWLNDPNGLVWHKGTYHLFFQHNPRGNQWGNMTWGHAQSSDLVHWEQLDDAIRPDSNGTIFSGSAVVDKRNTAGFGAGAIVAMFTYAGEPFTQGIAYSTDQGRTFTKYPRPVLENYGPGNRDPKVFWHQPSRAWRMALYLGTPGRFAIFGAPDLKHWTKLSDVKFPDGAECPELFEIPVEGQPGKTRWVFWEGAGRYMVGWFDGTNFVAETGVLQSEWGANSYAGQTYNNEPKGRRVLITWMRGGSYPDMPFNQQMSIPRELSLRNTDAGLRLFQMPVREVEALRRANHHWANEALAPRRDLLGGLGGELLDLDLELKLGDAKAVELGLRGNTIRYDARTQTLMAFNHSASLAPRGGERIKLRVLLDVTSLEIFANDGQVTMSFALVPDLDNKTLSLTSTGGTARVVNLDVYQLRSIYAVPEPSTAMIRLLPAGIVGPLGPKMDSP